LNAPPLERDRIVVHCKKLPPRPKEIAADTLGAAQNRCRMRVGLEPIRRAGVAEHLRCQMSCIFNEFNVHEERNRPTGRASIPTRCTAADVAQLFGHGGDAAGDKPETGDPASA